jgi:hypothetical protein
MISVPSVQDEAFFEAAIFPAGIANPGRPQAAGSGILVQLGGVIHWQK